MVVGLARTILSVFAHLTASPMHRGCASSTNSNASSRVLVVKPSAAARVVPAAASKGAGSTTTSKGDEAGSEDAKPGRRRNAPRAAAKARRSKAASAADPSALLLAGIAASSKQTKAAAAAAEASSQASAALPAQQTPAAVGMTSMLHYHGNLPGLAEVKVFQVHSASSKEYKDLLQHVAAARLVGMDVEPAVYSADLRTAALINCMVPAAVADTGQQWGDCAYLVDLVAAGLVSEAGPPKAGSVAASELMKGIAAVLRQSRVTVVMHDHRWDQQVLEEDCGIKPWAVLDTQHCWAILQWAGLAPATQPLMRPSLVNLLETFGLKHPNKECRGLNKSLPQGCATQGRFLVAPRPLPLELIDYSVSDVRYLIALALIMQLKMHRAYPLAYMHELQAIMPADLGIYSQKTLSDTQAAFGQTLSQQLLTAKVPEASQEQLVRATGDQADPLVLPPPEPSDIMAAYTLPAAAAAAAPTAAPAEAPAAVSAAPQASQVEIAKLAATAAQAAAAASALVSEMLRSQ